MAALMPRCWQIKRRIWAYGSGTGAQQNPLAVRPQAVPVGVICGHVQQRLR